MGIMFAIKNVKRTKQHSMLAGKYRWEAQRKEFDALMKKVDDNSIEHFAWLPVKTDIGWIWLKKYYTFFTNGFINHKRVFNVHGPTTVVTAEKLSKHFTFPV